jgi:hypothetical protein
MADQDQIEQNTKNMITDRRKSRSVMQSLNGAISQNTLGQQGLSASFLKAVKATADLSRVMVSTGNQELMIAKNLNSTLDSAGMNMQQSIAMFEQMAKAGIDVQDKSAKKLLAQFTVLGKNVAGMAQMYAFNTQTLGLSTATAARLGETLLETGAAYGLETDILVGALQTLSKTLIQTSVTYSSETALAVQQATTHLIGVYGAANKDLITKAATQLFAGNKASTDMAMKLNVGLDALRSRDPRVIVNAFQKAVDNLQDRVGAFADTGTAGYIVPGVTEAFGGSAEMLAISKLIPLNEEQLKLDAEAQVATQLNNDILASLQQMEKDFMTAVMPFIEVAGMFFSFVSPIFNMMGGVFGKLLAVTLIMKATNGLFKVEQAFNLGKIVMRLHSLGRINTAILTESKKAAIERRTQSLKKQLPGGFGPGIGKNLLGLLGGPLGLGLTALTFLPMLFNSNKEQEKTSIDTLAELEKQTKLADPTTKDNEYLKQIANGIVQNNIYSEMLANLSEEQMELLKTNSGGTSTFTGSLNDFDLQTRPTT